jgi:hypothetical protein
MKKFFISTFLLFFLLLNNLLGEEKSIKFIALGHVYPIIDDEKRMNSLIKKINSHKPDYVFILGDSKVHVPKYLNNYKSKIKSNIFFTPGNHDLSQHEAEYRNNIGYFNKVLEKENVKFLLLNSSDKKENIQNFLKKNLKDNFKGITILLTHHRIWDDTLISPKPFDHDKSFYFEDIYPIIKNKVNAIFAGNSKRQHFRDFIDDELSFGKQNVNLIYWLDKIGSIELYAVGMGDGKPKANFVVVEIINNKILVKGDYSTTEDYDVLPKNLIVNNQLRFNKYDTTGVRKLVKDKYYLINKKKTYLILTLFFLALLILFRMIKK